MFNLSVLKDASEIVHYDNEQLPIYMRHGDISSFTDHETLCHWHDDVEYVKVLKGQLSYSINGELILIKEQEAVLINTRMMHYAFSKDKCNCEFYCVLFRPQLLCENDMIRDRYIQPLLDQSQKAYALLSQQNEQEQNIMKGFDYIFSLYQQQHLGFELEMLSQLHLIWLAWYRLWKDELNSQLMKGQEDLLLQKQMVAYIYQQYAKRITLQEIAAAGGVCRSRCCQLFKKYLKKTPVEFLNAYRLETSMNLLRTTDRSITEVALSCGFNNPSYFSELFLKYKGCTPKQFRNYPKPVADQD